MPSAPRATAQPQSMGPEFEIHSPAAPGAGPSLPPVGRPIEARIAAEQLALMYGLTPAPVWASVAFAAVLTVMLLRVAPQGLVLGWAAVMFTLCAVRATETARYRADPQRDSRAAYWRRRYLVLMVLYCLTWSALFLLFAGYTSGVGFALLLAGMVGIAGVGVLTTFGVMTASLWFVGALLGPLVLWFARLGGPAGLASAAGGVVYAAVLIQQAGRSQTRQAEMLRLRLENAAIAEQRARALALAD